MKFYFIFFVSFTAFAAPESDFYYSKVFEDGRLDVTVALGFEQAFVPFVHDETNTVKDIDRVEWRLMGSEFISFKSVVRLPGYRELQALIPIDGRNINVVVRLVYPTRGVTQASLRDQFTQALWRDDVIVYLGHSREGRGFPDFGPPTSDMGKVFSKNMFAGWMGFDRGYFSPKKYQILMLNSCKTDQVFKDVIRTNVWEKSPDLLSLILTSDDTFFDDSAGNTLALLESLLQKKSADETLLALDRSSWKYQREQGGTKDSPASLFVGDGFLNAAYRGVPAAKRPARKVVWDYVPY